MTSRIRDWPLYWVILSLDSLSSEAAIRYLLDRVARKEHNAGNEADAASLACALENFPMALEQAASFIIQVRWSFEKYRNQLGNATSKFGRGTLTGNVMEKALSITLDQLSPIPRALLRIAGFAPDAIPRGIFSADKDVLFEALEMNVTSVAVENALGELSQFSLIRLEEECLSLHRVVQRVERDLIDNDQRYLVWACRLFTAFAPMPHDVHTRKIWMGHAIPLIEHARQHGVNAPPVASLINQVLEASGA